MLLSDFTILNKLKQGLISIFDYEGPIIYDSRVVQPASIDLTLGDTLFKYTEEGVIDSRNPESKGTYFDISEEGFNIQPYEFVLAVTAEHITIPDDVGGFFCNRSTIGRLGLFTENAGFVDPNWSGRLTLELFNARKRPMRLYPGMPIGQLVLMPVDEPTINKYGSKAVGSKYQHSYGLVPSRL